MANLHPRQDGSLSEVFGALCSGAELLLWSPPDFVTPMRELRATHVVLTPTALSAITPGSLPHVRVVAAGGEALPIALARAWQPHVERVVNAYGGLRRGCAAVGAPQAQHSLCGLMDVLGALLQGAFWCRLLQADLCPAGQLLT